MIPNEFIPFLNFYIFSLSSILSSSGSPSSISSFKILVSKDAMPLYNFFNWAVKAIFERLSAFGFQSMRALLVLELLVMLDDKVKLDNAIEFAGQRDVISG